MNKIKIAVALVCLSLNACEAFRKHSGTGRNNNEIVILVSGQSNGVSPVQGNCSPVYSVTGLVSVVHEHIGINTLTVPTQTAPMMHNASWIKLGDMLAARTGKSVKIINVAFGNTSTRGWQQYIPTLQSAVKRYHPEVVLWVQGESDQIDNVPAEEAYQNMQNIIKHRERRTNFFVGSLRSMDSHTIGSMKQRTQCLSGLPRRDLLAKE